MYNKNEILEVRDRKEYIMVNNRMKLGLSLLTVLATPIAVNAVASNDAQAAQGWVKSGNTWSFYNQNGTLVRNAWAGNYWLGADGKMATNAWVDNDRYYVGANGAWVKGAQNQTTIAQSQTTSTQGQVTVTNAMKQGWVKEANVWFYYNTDGTLARNKWAGNYWLGADGKMVTNAWVDNGRYYVGANGAWVKDARHPEEKKTGWVKEANTWYYYNTDGTLARNKWAGNYWLGADGKMATNAWVDNGRYYVGANGAWVKGAQNQTTIAQSQATSTQGQVTVTNAMKQGWVKEANVWFYYNTDGTLARNKWAGNYWLGADGRMVTNSWVDNNRYYVGTDGVWVKDAKHPEEKKTGWVKEANAWFYYNPDGTLARNKWAGNYWLGSDGKMATNAWVDNGRYYVDVNGAWVPNFSKSYKNVSALNMPQYYQWDRRWGRKVYGISTMAESGCVPASLAMVFNGLGQKVLPTAVADTIYNNTNEMNVRMIGTSGKGAVYAINAYGYKHSVITSKAQLIAALQSGKPVFGNMGRGIFASGTITHAIILSGYNNGKTKAMDPYTTYNTGKWYDVNTIWNQRSTDPYDNNIGGTFVAIG